MTTPVRLVLFFTAYRTPFFSGTISVSLYGKSYYPPTDFHTFYVVHNHKLITHAGSPVHALKSVRPEPIARGPSHALIRHAMRKRVKARSRGYVWISCGAGIRRVVGPSRTSYSHVVDCDSSGEEPTTAMIFGRMNLSSMHAAPKEDG